VLAKALSGAVIGIDAYIVEVEVDIASGLPAFTTVGLPEMAVKESRERVKSAITNSGYRFPDDRITINLAPAHIKKDGTGYDLPMAVGILAAMGIVPKEELGRFLIMGELSLDGRVKPVGGALPMALAARQASCKGLVLPYENRLEAAVVEAIDALPVDTLSEVVEFLRGDLSILPETVDLTTFFGEPEKSEIDFSEVVGQDQAKRAIEVAAAGGHNLVMIGPPGAGKTMLARRLPTVLPSLTFEEALETTKIYSVVGGVGPHQGLITSRPFRSPHHTISDAGLIGGGHIPRPGEVSLAHNGVLFLDEFPEFKKHVLEVLRQPLEDSSVTISRAATTLTYPSRFMLVAAMNPCPCGYLGDTKQECRCSLTQIRRYRTKISGPLMDRMDIQIEVPAVHHRDLTRNGSEESSGDIRRRVGQARAIQHERFRSSPVHCNAQMHSRHIPTFCRISTDSRRLLEAAADKLSLSARAYHRILKIARTIADLEAIEDIHPGHIAEGIQYRSLDRFGMSY
jgi:magnesium chelatase family protein